eukprot:6198858-Pleurochrysis_carterae.AAC.1
MRPVPVSILGSSASVVTSDHKGRPMAILAIQIHWLPNLKWRFTASRPLVCSSFTRIKSSLPRLRPGQVRQFQ